MLNTHCEPNRTNIKNISNLYKSTTKISKITSEIEKFIVDITIKNKIMRCKTEVFV